MAFRTLGLLLAFVLSTACAAKKPPSPGSSAVPSALTAAREAVKEAATEQAETRAPESYAQALELLRLAEQSSGTAALEAAVRAEGAARLAAAQARCKKSVAASPANGDELARAQEALKQSQEERRRLEERVALLRQALEQTETELIRSKARLKGIETKAQASSAIAEARILVRRLGARSAAATECDQSLAKAERQLAAENYGAAMFFALKAQDTASRALAAQARP